MTHAPVHPPSQPPTPADVEKDLSHLKTLAIFYYILGGMVGFISLIFIIHILMGILILAGPDEIRHGDEEVAQLAGWVFIAMGGCAMLFSWVMAICMILTGRKLTAQRGYTFCFVMACMICLNIPLGTVLGVFTLVVLNRPRVKALFDAATETPAGLTADRVGVR